ncbi:hypothetical protein Tco_0431647 [Tanacetum coccineum]
MEDSDKTESVSSGQTAHPQDTEENTQSAIKGFHSPLGDGTSKSKPLTKSKNTTQPLPKGTNIYPKDSERLKTLVDRDSSNPIVTALSGTDVKYQPEYKRKNITQSHKPSTENHPLEIPILTEAVLQTEHQLTSLTNKATEHQSPSPNKDVDEMAFGGNTRDLDSIWEETYKNSTLHEFQYQKSIQWVETASQSIVTALGGSSHGVRILVTASEVALRRFMG